MVASRIWFRVRRSEWRQKGKNQFCEFVSGRQIQWTKRRAIELVQLNVFHFRYFPLPFRFDLLFRSGLKGMANASYLLEDVSSG